MVICWRARSTRSHTRVLATTLRQLDALCARKNTIYFNARASHTSNELREWRDRKKWTWWIIMNYSYDRHVIFFFVLQFLLSVSVFCSSRLDAFDLVDEQRRSQHSTLNAIIMWEEKKYSVDHFLFCSVFCCEINYWLPWSTDGDQHALIVSNHIHR